VPELRIGREMRGFGLQPREYRAVD